MHDHRIRWFPGLAWVVGALAAAAGAGCSSGPVHAPVEANKARETLRTALESWKKGDKSDALQKATPPVYVIDGDWQAGAKLSTPKCEPMALR
jgi:hypothetical protein